MEDNGEGGWCCAKEEREKKDYSAKDYRSEVYEQYLDEIAAIPPSPPQAQRDQGLLSYFSCEQMSTVPHENETKGDTASLERA